MFSLIIYILIAAIGFMMAFLYKKSYTTAQFFNVEPKKLFKAFLFVFFLAVVLTLGLSWYSMHVLKDVTIPEDSAMRYMDTKSIIIFIVNISFLLLVVLSNFYSQSLKKLAIVPYLLAFGLYAVFILIDGYYISGSYIDWQKSMQLLKEEVSDPHSTEWTKCAIAFGITSFNALAIWWGLRK